MILATKGASSLAVPMSLTEFYDALERFDWYYTFSDDAGVYRAGEWAAKQLELIAQQTPAHQALLNGFSAHYFSGTPWGTEQAPKPVRPVAP